MYYFYIYSTPCPFNRWGRVHLHPSESIGSGFYWAGLWIQVWQRDTGYIYPEIFLSLFPGASGHRFNFQYLKLSHLLKLQLLVSMRNYSKASKPLMMQLSTCFTLRALMLVKYKGRKMLQPFWLTSDPKMSDVPTVRGSAKHLKSWKLTLGLTIWNQQPTSVQCVTSHLVPPML